MKFFIGFQMSYNANQYKIYCVNKKCLHKNPHFSTNHPPALFGLRIFEPVKAELNIDGYIGPDDFFSMMEGCSSFNLKKLNDFISSLDPDVDEIDVLINSGGGMVTEGFAIHDRLKSLGKKINTIVLGQCGSIATIIHQANANGGLRKMYENSDYFIHNPFVHFMEPVDAEGAKALSEELQKAQDKILNFYHEVTGTKKSELKKKMDEATSLSADEARKLGFVDEVIETVISDQKRYAIAAYVNQKSNSMLDIKKMFADFKNEMTETIKAIVKPTEIKNAQSTTDDGTVIYYDGELKVGTKCFIDAEMQRPLDNGTYKVDGTSYVVVDGAVAEVIAVEDNTEALKTENESLKQQVSDLTEAARVANEKVTEVQNTLNEKVASIETEVNQKIENFKSNFFTGDKLKPEFTQNFRDENAPPADEKLTPIQIAAKRRKEAAAQV